MHEVRRANSSRPLHRRLQYTIVLRHCHSLRSEHIHFIERFIRRVFLAERKVVSRHSEHVAILTCRQQKGKKHDAQDVNCANQDIKDASDTEQTSRVCVARQVLLNPYTQHRVLVSTTSSGFLTIEPRNLRSRRQHALAARGIMEVSPDQLFHIPASNFPNMEIRQPKHKTITHATNLPDVVTAIKKRRYKKPLNREPGEE